LALAFLLWGCYAQPSLNLGQPGKSLSYSSGLPSFDMEAVPGAGGVEVFLSIPCLSLTFLKQGNEFQAQTQVSVCLYDPGTSALIVDVAWAESTVVSSYEESRSADPIVITRIVHVSPGEHLLVATLEDRATGRSESRSQLLNVHDPSDTRPSIGRVVLQSRNAKGALAPVVPFHIPAGTPGLRVLTCFYGLIGARRAVITTMLERFRIEQQPAVAPNAMVFTPGIGDPRRILFDTPDTVWVRKQTLNHASPDTGVVQQLDSLRPGLYKIIIEAAVPMEKGGADTVLAASRVISIKPAGFPKPVTLTQLMEAMVYILKPLEIRHLASAKSPDRERVLFDSLWLSFCPNATEASGLIRRYYSRVEEANRQFTDLKEGWKTDRGMVFVLLGPPSEISNNLDRQVWYYDLPGSQGIGSFIFRRMVIGEGETSVMTFVLYRDAQYEQLWLAIVARWRRCEGW
jgi:GWxTD domain-containing protein